MIKSGKVTVGEVSIDVYDPGVPALFVDLITGTNEVGGTVSVDLAVWHRDEAGPVEATVQCRLRMNAATAMDLRNALSRLIGPENISDSAKN